MDDINIIYRVIKKSRKKDLLNTVSILILEILLFITSLHKSAYSILVLSSIDIIYLFARAHFRTSTEMLMQRFSN